MILLLWFRVNNKFFHFLKGQEGREVDEYEDEENHEEEEEEERWEDTAPERETESQERSVGAALQDSRYNELFPGCMLTTRVREFLGAQFPEFLYVPMYANLTKSGLAVDGKVIPGSELFLGRFRGREVVGFLNPSEITLEFSSSWKKVNLEERKEAKEVDLSSVLRAVFTSPLVRESDWNLERKDGVFR